LTEHGEENKKRLLSLLAKLIVLKGINRRKRKVEASTEEDEEEQVICCLEMSQSNGKLNPTEIPTPNCQQSEQSHKTACLKQCAKRTKQLPNTCSPRSESINPQDKASSPVGRVLRLRKSVVELKDVPTKSAETTTKSVEIAVSSKGRKSPVFRLAVNCNANVDSRKDFTCPKMVNLVHDAKTSQSPKLSSKSLFTYIAINLGCS